MAGNIEGMIVFGGPRVEEESSMESQDPGPRKEEEGQAIPVAIATPLPEEKRYQTRKPSHNGFWDGLYQIPAPEGESKGEEEEEKEGSGAGPHTVITITRERIELRAESAAEADSKAKGRGQWKPTPFYTTTKKEDEEVGLAPAKVLKVGTPEERPETKVEVRRDNPFDLGGTVVKKAIVDLEKELVKREEARRQLNRGVEAPPGLVTGKPHELMTELGQLALSWKVWAKEGPKEGEEEEGLMRKVARARDLVAWLSSKRERVQRSIEEIERYRAPGPPPAGPWGLYPSPEEEVDSDGDEVAPRFPKHKETPVKEDQRLRREEAESDEGFFPSLEVKSESDEDLLPRDGVESESDEDLRPSTEMEEMDCGSGGEEVSQIPVRCEETSMEKARREWKEAKEELLAKRAKEREEKMRAEDEAVREEYRERNEHARQEGRRKETREEILAKLAEKSMEKMLEEDAKTREAGRERFLFAWRNGKREEVMRHVEVMKRRNQVRPPSPCQPNPWRQYPAEEWESPCTPTEEVSASSSSEPETVIAAGTERPATPEGDSGLEEEEEDYPSWMANLDPEGELQKEGEDWGLPARIVYRPALEEVSMEEILAIWGTKGTQTDGPTEEDAGVIEEIKAIRARGRTHLDHIRRLEATCAYIARKRQRQENIKADLEKQVENIAGQGQAIRVEITRLEENLEDLLPRVEKALQQVHVLLAQPDKVWTFEKEVIYI